MLKELQIAKKAVVQASRLAAKVATVHVKSISKEDKSPVTVADFAAQALIISALHAAFPQDKIVGEEDSSKLQENEALAAQVLGLAHEFAPEDPRFATNTPTGLFEAIDLGSFGGSATGRQWALDPVDGTKGFLRGGQYAVCLALIVDAKVEVGVIGCPNLGPHGGLFSTVRGKGAWYEPLFDESTPTAEPQPIHFRPLGASSDAVFCESVESGHSDQKLQASIASELGITSPPLQMDSQAKYCVLAKGDADIYLRLPVSYTYEEKIWDHAAGSLLVTEAGGTVTDKDGKELDFGQGRTLKNNKGIVASAAAVHPRIISTIAAIKS